MGQSPSLKPIVAALVARYGAQAAPVTDPFEMILHENAAYLVNDVRRMETFLKLRLEVGLTPKAILARPADDIARVIAGGGMRPPMRAQKVIECAAVALKQDLRNLRKAVVEDPAHAKTLLRQYPGVGEPLADRILLFNGASVALAPDSNALRALLRLGFGVERNTYAASYRSALDATKGAFKKAADAQQAHGVLRRHGQELCTRTSPRCDRCPVRSRCAWLNR